MTRGIVDFAAFYRLHAVAVHRYAFALARNHDDADDITAETFVRVWTNADRVESETVLGYLFTIARHVHLKSVRLRARQLPLIDGIVDAGSTPDELLEAELLANAIAARLGAVSQIDRAAFELRTERGLDYKTIARMLDISVTAAKVKVHRIRRLLLTIR